MNTQPRTTIIQLTVATFVWFAAFPCIAQGTLYRFTGKVIDSGIPDSFTLDLGLIPGTELRVGDPVTGTIEVLSKPIRFPADAFPEWMGVHAYLNSSQEFEIGGKSLSNGDAVTTAATINNPKPDDPDLGALYRPLASLGDAYILNISSQDVQPILVDGTKPLRSDYIEIFLNLTDSTGSVFSSVDHPAKLDLERFDKSLGYILPVIGNGVVDVDRGIAFSVDSIQEAGDTDTENPIVTIKPATPVPSLTTGFHVSWPSVSEGYVLQESETPNGPWTTHDSTPLVSNDQNVVLMNLNDRSRFYRLHPQD